MSDIEIAWAAGLFEGEGTITSAKRPNGKRHLRLALGSTDEDVVRRFHAAVGVGSVGGPYGPYVEGRKPHWQWHSACRKANQALDLLLPHLGERRVARAEEVRSLVG